jgi:hypothetical protein
MRDAGSERPAGCIFAEKPQGMNGGRTRIRTLDPLIKSPLCIIDSKQAFFQMREKGDLIDQQVSRRIPTGR